MIASTDVKNKRSCQSFSKMLFLLLKTDKTVLMDKFVVKTPAVSSTKKASSHLPPNMTAHDQARKYPKGTSHMDDGLMFCSMLLY